MTPEERMATLAKTPFQQIGNSTVGVGGFWSTLKEIIGRRSMLGLLIRRDLKSRYKDSSLGFLWTLIRPLTQLVIFYFVVGKFLGAARGIPDFAVYIFTGLTIYGLFSEIVSAGTNSIVSNSGLIKKVYLPREIFPLASLGTALFNFCIQMVILIAATIALGRIPLTPSLAYAIPSVAIIVIWGLALALLLSAVNVYLRDVQYLVEVFVMVMMYASPIIYSWVMVKDTLGNGLLLQIFTNNPVTLAVIGFQKAFWVGGQENGVALADRVGYFPPNLLPNMLIACVVGLVFMFIAQRVFARLQGNFAQAL